VVMYESDTGWSLFTLVSSANAAPAAIAKLAAAAAIHNLSPRIRTPLI